MDVMNFLLSNGYGTGVSNTDSLVKTRLAELDVNILNGVDTDFGQPDRALRSSTENSQNNAWNVNFSSGNTNNNNKYNSNSVRAVAALDEEIKIGWINAFDDCCGKKKSSPQCNDYRIDYELDLWMLIASVYERNYIPDVSTCFMVTHPKLREIFAAHFRDRIVQHWVIMRLEPLFEKRFNEQGNVSFNCRKNFGTQKAVSALEADIVKVSANYSKDVCVARFDLRSFFMSINLDILWKFLKAFIIKEYKGDDIDVLLYLTEIIVYHRPQLNCYRKGKIELWDELPPYKSLFNLAPLVGMAIGNLTSQQFANFYMSFFDEFMIWLCARYGCEYKRFVDDFSVVGNRDVILHIIRPLAEKYLAKHLDVVMHRDKFYLQPVRHGIKFVGTVIMPFRRYISNRTVGGMVDKLRLTERVCRSILRGNRDSRNLEMLRHCVSALNSYLGFTVHVNGHKLRHNILDKASQDFWDVCYVVGDYNVIKIKKHFQFLTYLKELSDAEFKQSVDIRSDIPGTRRGGKKVRNEAKNNQLRHKGRKERRVQLPLAVRNP
ncbi:MAG: RNA-directed DNA polymerase [Roseburia sp.]|nr:RNA-directed DNA polymerase [Roseburia sp.]